MCSQFYVLVNARRCVTTIVIGYYNCNIIFIKIVNIIGL
jgi:hypothetical protein